MKKAGVQLAVAMVCIFAVQAVAAQEQEPAPKTAWTVSTTPSRGEPKGYVQYEDYCSVCHGEGVGKPGTMALQAKYKGALPALLEKRTDLTPEMIRTYVRQGYSVMPIFRKTEISDADLDAIVAYLTRNNKK
ncbi:MAG TPA: cytochrome c [Candidatus Polarisedimenticolia bacterium]|nr:cytochrome c [Candidatus Polarisedimenticolia bacterium]